MTRRQWLALAAGQAAFAQNRKIEEPDRRPGIAEIVREYESQAG